MSFMATQQSLKVDDSSTPDASEKKGGGKHRRNYQACEPCRERKVKCDLGNVDNPLPPPCAKCKREQKECWFRDTRKKEGAVKEEAPPAKRRRTDSAHSHTSFAPLPVSPQISQNYTYQNPLSPARPYAPNALPNTPPLPGLSYATQPRSTPGDYRTPPNGSVPLYKKQDDVWGTKNTSAGFQQPLRNGDDHVVMPHASSLNRPFTNTTDNMSVLISAAKSTEAAHNTADRAKRTHSLMGEPLQTQGKPLSPSEAKARLEARKVWSNVKFVKAGWFSPDEALDYIKFFYTKLAPMTPVRVQEFADPSQHDRLLKEEPVLALAILAITSRYMEFNHPSKVGRGYYVHEKLWNSLQKIVQRLLWGQEQFGGGFTGAGNVHTQQSATGQITWKGSLRTLGTIEALLLLTDWQPRALHFPPGDDENKLVGGTTSLMEEDIATPAPSANIPYATWLEPAWRSDRMSWMLLGLAVHLGHELAVFDRSHEICKMDHSEQSDCMRRRRVRRLIITYVSQISGRIGIQPSLAPNYDKEDSRAPDADTPDDVMQKLWFQIAHIMYDANQDIFPTHEKTAEYIENGHYKNLIGGFAPRLRSWLNKFDNAKPQLDPMMANVLRMEYEYARLYIHSLGLQKVVGEMATQNRSSIGKGFSSQLGSVYDDNKVYIDEVRSAARAILECSCYGIGNHNALGYAPVRTFLRALSALMFSLKLLSLGSDERAVRKIFHLMREMTKRMREQTADDVHLSPHVARLIQSLMEQVHSTMVRIPKPASRSATRQPTPAPLHHHAGSVSDTSDQQSPDPLGEIQFANLANQTIMPPPGFDMTYEMPFDQSVDPALFPSSEDWIAMPFDGLLDFDASGTGTVNFGYGGIGPTFGDRDMLSLITGSHLDQMQHGLGSGMPTDMNGTNFGVNGTGY